MREISDSIDYETKSMACVPLKIGKRTIGVVQVINKKDQTQFSQADMDVLEEFSNLAALAIGSAQNLEQVRKENLDLKKELGEKHQIIGTSPILKRALVDAQCQGARHLYTGTSLSRAVSATAVRAGRVRCRARITFPAAAR